MAAEITKTFDVVAVVNAGEQVLPQIQIADGGDAVGTKYVIKYLALYASAGFIVVPGQTFTTVDVLAADAANANQNELIFKQDDPAPGASTLIPVVDCINFEQNNCVKEVVLLQSYLNIKTRANAGNVFVIVSYIKIPPTVGAMVVNNSFGGTSTVLPTVNTANVVIFNNAAAQTAIIKAITINNNSAASFDAQLSITGAVFITDVVSIAAYESLIIQPTLYLPNAQEMFVTLSNYAAAAAPPTAYISYNLSS